MKFNKYFQYLILKYGIAIPSQLLIPRPWFKSHYLPSNFFFHHATFFHPAPTHTHTCRYWPSKREKINHKKCLSPQVVQNTNRTVCCFYLETTSGGRRWWCLTASAAGGKLWWKLIKLSDSKWMASGETFCLVFFFATSERLLLLFILERHVAMGGHHFPLAVRA